MARPVKNNADYFTHDSAMRNDIKIRALRRKFGHVGYAVWNYLLEALTDSENFRIVWNEMNVELYAADFDVDVPQLTEIVAYCITLDLFQMEEGCLSSRTLCERFDSLVNRRRRERVPVEENGVSGNDNSRKGEFCGVICNDNSQIKGLSAPETPQNTPITPQNPTNKGVSASFAGFSSRESRVEKSRVKKSREENISSSRTCAGEEALEEKKKEIFEIFFFKNYQNPGEEVARFVAWNTEQGRDLSANNAELWSPKTGTGRFSEGFLKAWKTLYATARFSGTDGDRVADAMLDKGVSMRAINGKWQLSCPDVVCTWINDNSDAAAEIFKPMLRGVRMDIRPYRRT